MAANIKTQKRMKLFKRLGVIGLATSVFAITVVTIIAFLPHGNDAFTIQLNDIEQAQAKFTLTNSLDGKPISYARGTPITEGKTTTASAVESFLDSVDHFEGQQNMVVEVQDKAYEAALIYTVYLENNSLVEDQEVYYTVNLDGVAKPSNDAAFPLDYFRVLIQSEVVGDDSSITNTYFGQKRTTYLESPNEHNDNREPIAIDRSKPFSRDEDNNSVLTTDFASKGNDGYCNNFVDYELNGAIVDDENISKVVIPAGRKIRFTFAAYFEGNDLDCEGPAPKNSYLLLSLHFGIKNA